VNFAFITHSGKPTGPPGPDSTAPIPVTGDVLSMSQGECQGAPYAFHPMYDTAAAPLPSGQPTAWTTWAAHTDNIAHSAEVGHFEPRDKDFDDSCNGSICFATDTDFDGFSYHPDWPNGSARFPTAEYLSSPRSLGPRGSFNQTYPTARFETVCPGSRRPTPVPTAVTTIPGRTA
jgi:hypothetical protein